MSYIKTADGFKITVLAKKKVVMLAFILIWLAAWTFCGIASISAFIKGNEPLIPWIAFWGIFECLLLCFIIWSFFGREIVLVSDNITVQKVIFGYSLSRSYPIAEVTDLRATGYFWDVMFDWNKSWSWGAYVWGIGGGSIVFEWRNKTIRFGILLLENEARDVVAKIRPYLSDCEINQQRPD